MLSFITKIQCKYRRGIRSATSFLQTIRLRQILTESGGNVIETLIGTIKMNAGNVNDNVYPNPWNYAHNIYVIVIACICYQDIYDNICPQCRIYHNIKNATNQKNTTFIFEKDPSNPNPSLTEYKNECATRIMRGNIKGSVTKKKPMLFPFLQ